jgi:selenophosphate synthase
MVPEGTRRNLDWVEDRLHRGNADDITVTLLADAQTSGGLAFVAAGDSARRAVEQLRASGHACAVIGRTVAGTGRITLTSSPR